MKPLITILLAFLCLNASAQKFLETKDAFTGMQTKSAIVFTGSTFNPNSPMLIFAEQGGKKVISFYWPAYAGINGAFNRDTIQNMSLLFKMENDTILQFKANPAISLKSTDVNTTTLVIQSFITDDQLRYFAENKVRIFRLGQHGINGVDLNDLFTPKKMEEFRNAAAHMLNMVVFTSE